jgi:hypothetical protein
MKKRGRPGAGTEPKARRRYDTSGMHVRCAEAQADGVPCGELRADCDLCAHGLLGVWRDGHWEELPPASAATEPPA